MRFRTARAPPVFARRVATPLCWITFVLPSIVATPFCTETVKCSALIFDFVNFARMTRSIWASGTLAVMAFGLATDAAWLSPAIAAARTSAEHSLRTLYQTIQQTGRNENTA